MRAKKMTGRKCYDHLGGRLGAALFEFFLSQEWLQLEEGTSTVYVITKKGYEAFEKMGLRVDRDTGAV